MDVDRAAGTIFALASPDVARMLCSGRGWTDDDYAAWLEDALARALLPDEPPSTTRPTRDVPRR